MKAPIIDSFDFKEIEHLYPSELDSIAKDREKILSQGAILDLNLYRDKYVLAGIAGVVAMEYGLVGDFEKVLNELYGRRFHCTYHVSNKFKKIKTNNSIKLANSYKGFDIYTGLHQGAVDKLLKTAKGINGRAGSVYDLFPKVALGDSGKLKEAFKFDNCFLTSCGITTQWFTCNPELLNIRFGTERKNSLIRMFKNVFLYSDTWAYIENDRVRPVRLFVLNEENESVSLKLPGLVSHAHAHFFVAMILRMFGKQSSLMRVLIGLLFFKRMSSCYSVIDVISNMTFRGRGGIGLPIDQVVDTKRMVAFAEEYDKKYDDNVSMKIFSDLLNNWDVFIGFMKKEKKANGGSHGVDVHFESVRRILLALSNFRKLSSSKVLSTNALTNVESSLI